GDHRLPVYRHLPVLRVLVAEQFYRPAVLGVARLDKRGGAAHQNIAQAAPILVIGVYEQRHLWVRQDIAHALEAGGGYALGLVVEGYVEALSIKGVADRHDVRAARGVGGS